MQLPAQERDPFSSTAPGGVGGHHHHPSPMHRESVLHTGGVSDSKDGPEAMGAESPTAASQTSAALESVAPSLLEDDEIKKNCALALCNFSSQDGFRAKIVDAGAISALVALWETAEVMTPDPSTCTLFPNHSLPHCRRVK